MVAYFLVHSVEFQKALFAGPIRPYKLLLLVSITDFAWNISTRSPAVARMADHTAL